ncbi:MULTISPECIES: hypothetical protein [Pseudomonas]|uniref:hypothetical protein n=1 Tax=Pseudomonas TaxID=286 RepID=UPI0015B63A43|nr:MULTISPECIES: hypothetical protein [Pseudomonas]MBF7144965.1 hypothetical protein [Pseudomonas sp. LY10J]
MAEKTFIEWWHEDGRNEAGMDSTSSDGTKPDTYKQPSRLSPLEIESLRQEMRRDGYWMKQHIAKLKTPDQ